MVKCGQFLVVNFAKDQIDIVLFRVKGTSYKKCSNVAMKGCGGYQWQP